MAKREDFKVGMRVKALEDQDGLPITCELGTVVFVGLNIGIEFDENVEGHSCDGKAKQGHGWFVPPEKLEIIEDKKLFKIGDKVRVVTSNIDRHGVCRYENEIGTITAIDKNYAYPYLVKGTSYGNELWCTVKALVEDKKEERKKDEFRPGDRVRVFAAVGKKNVKNAIGTLIGKQESLPSSWLIEFDEDIEGHKGNGIIGIDGKELTCESKRGWYVMENLFKLLGEGDFDFSIETDVYIPKPIEVVVIKFTYEELFQLRFAHRQGFVYAAKMNNELWFFKEDPNYPSAFKIAEVI